MNKNFKNQLAGQIGENLVVAELGRRGIVATSFTGNVPDIDILCYRDGKSYSIQVKSWRSGSVSFDARQFLFIEFNNNTQNIKNSRVLINNILYVFVKIGDKYAIDRFFIIKSDDLQKIIYNNYEYYLQKHNGVRPKNPKATHTAVGLADLLPYEDCWHVIEEYFI